MRLADVWAPALVWACSVASVGCSDAPGVGCTLMGCSDSMSVEMVAAAGSLPAGDYSVVVEIAGVEESCSVVTGSQGSGGSCTTNSMDLRELRAGNLFLSFRDTPETLTITVERDDVEVGSETIVPVYRDFYPNGEDCDTSPCRQASVQMTLS